MKSAWRSGVDTISNLPSDALDGILRCLPLKDAVKTSILSKNWRYKWIAREEIDFDDEFFRSCKDNEEVKTIIYQVLLQHKGPILKFRIEGFRDQGPRLMSCLDINHWILFLSKKNVQEFTLQIGSCNAYSLPSHLFTFQQLRYLELGVCLFHPPASFKGFEKLINLDLDSVDLVPSFISKCPLLERLRLHLCTGFDILEIDAANLKCFVFTGGLKSICFKNAPLLREVKVVMLELFRDPAPVSSNLTKFFHYMPSLQELDVCHSTLEYLTMGGLPESPPTALNNVKSIKFSFMSLRNFMEVAGAVYLITNCPKLEKLSVGFDSVSNVIEEPVVEYLEAQSIISYGAVKLLKTVDMTFFGGAGMQIEFIKFILASAPVLEKITIYMIPQEFLFCADIQMMEKKMKERRQASPNVSIVFV